MKMHWAVRTLLAPGHVPSRDPRLVLRAVQGAVGYMVSLVRSRVRIARVRLGLDCRCGVSRCQVRWLGLVAFSRVLRRCGLPRSPARRAAPPRFFLSRSPDWFFFGFSASQQTSNKQQAGKQASKRASKPANKQQTHNRKQAVYRSVLAVLESELRRPAYAQARRRDAAARSACLACLLACLACGAAAGAPRLLSQTHAPTPTHPTNQPHPPIAPQPRSQVAQQLAGVVAPARSSVFDDIKF
jgi:hypothetical protein